MVQPTEPLQNGYSTQYITLETSRMDHGGLHLGPQNQNSKQLATTNYHHNHHICTHQLTDKTILISDTQFSYWLDTCRNHSHIVYRLMYGSWGVTGYTRSGHWPLRGAKHSWSMGFIPVSVPLFSMASRAIKLHIRNLWGVALLALYMYSPESICVHQP